MMTNYLSFDCKVYMRRITPLGAACRLMLPLREDTLFTRVQRAGNVARLVFCAVSPAIM